MTAQQARELKEERLLESLDPIFNYIKQFILEGSIDWYSGLSTKQIERLEELGYLVSKRQNIDEEEYYEIEW